MTLRVLIVDDESLARANLRFALKSLTDWEIVNELASGQGVLERVKEGDIDLVFLDIRMPGMDGLQVSEQLLALEKTPIVVFITAYDQHAVEAFELCALDYLMKPFTDERLKKTIERIESMADNTDALNKTRLESHLAVQDKSKPLSQLVIRSVGRIDVVNIADIDWFLSAGNYVECHQVEKMHLHRVSMNLLEEQLPEGFIRSHRKAIVRVSAIETISTSDSGKAIIIMQSGAEVPLSKSYKADILAALSA